MESSKMIAQRLFGMYDRNGDGKIDKNEARNMIGDAYSAVNQKYEFQLDDDELFVDAHDRDHDGVVTQRDIERACAQFLCGPGGNGVSLLGRQNNRDALLLKLL
jgi:Ca2+-binding EF-hand superfamily protein